MKLVRLLITLHIYNIGYESESQKLDYKQYLMMIKHIIYLDQQEESKICESQETFEAWKSMNGDMNGFVKVAVLKQFLINVLDLQAHTPTISKVDPLQNEEVKEVEIELKNKHKIPYSEIDLLQASENEVRLESIDEKESIIEFSSPKHKNSMPVDPKVKKFLYNTLKQSQKLLKSSAKVKVESSPKEMKKDHSI